MQYLPSMKSSANTRNYNKFFHFHCDHKHENEECHTKKKKIERLIVMGYLQQFVKIKEKLYK